ncbi:MAG: aromatic hydrocarbon degradation protein [Candidatus Brocadia sp. WS118]|nr:MAG: aromatic hydrocarbon degradation protein [Candidatus Brocadia sp. WS118]
MHQKRIGRELAAFMFLFLVLCGTQNAYSSGFAIYTQGASALGQADSVIAHTDSPSSVFFNPALINKLEGTHIESGTTLIFPSREFKSDITGEDDETEDSMFYPSTVYVTHEFNEKISAGLGIFTPFGLATTWDDDWEGRYIATKSEMKTFNINPVVSYQILPNVSIAGGVDVLVLDTTLEKKINLSGFGLPDANQEFDGDGNGVGYNFGIVYDVNKDISFGASYRSEIKVDIEGDSDFDLPSVTPSPLRALFPDTDGKTDITLPQQVHVGVCYKGFDRLTLETTLRWEGWSSFDELKVDFDHPIAGSNESTTEKDWQNTYSANFGAKYQLKDWIALLGGYLYGGNPVPDKTFDPVVPDANTHLFTFGTSLKIKNFKIDLAYAYQLLEGRSKSNSVDDNSSDGFLNAATSTNGKYETDLHMVGISVGYNF